MAATSREHLIELTDDYRVFYERTGLLNYYQDLESLGFHMFSFSGHFMASQVPLLLDFCDKNRCYHVITITESGRYENRYVPDKRVYYLGDGDKDPNLVLYLFLHKNPELFAEEGFAQALAMFSKVDGGDQGE